MKDELNIPFINVLHHVWLYFEMGKLESMATIFPDIPDNVKLHPGNPN